MVRLLLACLMALYGCFTAAPLTCAGISGADIRSAVVRNDAGLMLPPVLRLGTEDKLRLNFDVIGDSHDYLRARIVHCNADWEPSRLMASEYSEGFNEVEISDYEYSVNTYVNYVNYNLVFPTEEFSPLESGNYLLQVFSEDNPEELLLEERFSVTETGLPLTGTMTTRTDFGFNTEWQQLEITVGIPEGVDPYQDIIVTVEQNGVAESRREIAKPMRVDGDKAVFSHDHRLVFPGGNEYRRFETVRVDYPGMGVDSVGFGGSNWHAWLKGDGLRAGHTYEYDRTQHGRFVIDEYNSTEPDLTADYITVHFFLDTPETPGVDVYVDGEFSRIMPLERAKMEYNRERGGYEAAIPLKQGSYNYRYLAWAPGNKREAGPIEGNFYETNNEYLVKVFLRTPGSMGDRLIGTVFLSD